MEDVAAALLSEPIIARVALVDKRRAQWNRSDHNIAQYIRIQCVLVRFTRSFMCRYGGKLCFCFPIYSLGADRTVWIHSRPSFLLLANIILYAVHARETDRRPTTNTSNNNHRHRKRMAMPNNKMIWEWGKSEWLLPTASQSKPTATQRFFPVAIQLSVGMQIALCSCCLSAPFYFIILLLLVFDVWEWRACDTRQCQPQSYCNRILCCGVACFGSL